LRSADCAYEENKDSKINTKYAGGMNFDQHNLTMPYFTTAHLVFNGDK